MHKIPYLILIGALLATSLATATPTTPKQTPNSTYTHTVFAELGSKTTCNNCPIAHTALDHIYKSGDYPFYYLSLVYDVNTHAEERQNEYNYAGWPTLWLDGGNLVDMGSYQHTEDDYRSEIQQTGARPVSNITIDLTVNWLGNATMTINASVHNAETTTYTGHIHVYVCEVQSTLWLDARDNPYAFAFLDYALNQNISIDASSTWTNTVTWDGHDHNDGYGHDFGFIQYGNIEVIAVVYNSQVHQGYSSPPHDNPFNAYWADDATGVWIGTPHPPEAPSNPDPTNGATNVDISKDLKWTCSDPDLGDGVSFDLYFGTTNPPMLCQTNLHTTTFDPGLLQFKTVYYWKLVARDNQGHTVEGPLWSFTTGEIIDTTPPTISIIKPKSGYFYVHDNDGKRLFLKSCVIIGPITIQANATDASSGIDKVVFAIDGQQKAEITTDPYSYFFDGSLFPLLPHKLRVTAYDESGNSADQTITLIKLL